MAKKELISVVYTCKCGNKQTCTFFPDDAPFPATCCVACRSGFNQPLSYGEMAMRGIGMMAGKSVHVFARPIPKEKTKESGW